MDIGSRIREHREAAGMKQDELAQACFVSRQAISNWERNRTLPDIESLKSIAGTFGTTVDALIGDDAPTIVEQADEQARQLVSFWAASFGAQAGALLMQLLRYRFGDTTGLLGGLQAFCWGVWFATSFPFQRLERKIGIRTVNDLCQYVTDHTHETESLAIRAARWYFRHYRLCTGIVIALLGVAVLLALDNRITAKSVLTTVLIVGAVVGVSYLASAFKK